MILSPSLLFLAQALIPSPSIPVSPDAVIHHGTPRHHAHAAPTPSPSPEVRVTVVNATSVPVITLGTAGTNLPPAYPSFPQGTWTGNAPLKTSIMDLVVRNASGQIIAEHLQHFASVSSQILLITGDLSTSGPAETPPQLGSPPAPGPAPWPPNLQFHNYPITPEKPALPGKPADCRYRVVNAMPSKLLVLRSLGEGNKPGRQLALLAPGNSALFIRQPANLQWEAEIDGQIRRVTIEQEEDSKNCLIPFFLRNGQPEFIRVFEE